MNHYPTKLIAISKPKAILAIVFGLAVLLLGAWLFSASEPLIAGAFQFKGLFELCLGALCALFGLIGIWIGFKNLLFSKVAFTFNEQGIIYHARAHQLIPWSAISGFDIFETNQQKLLVIKLYNPQAYIQQSSLLQRLLFRSNMDLCGSPVTISSTSAAIKFDDLVETSVKYYGKYGDLKNQVTKQAFKNFISTHYPYWIV